MKHLVRALLILSTVWITVIVTGQRNFNIELLSTVPQGGILTNDVWGYTDTSGVEYGVVGTRNEAIIYDLSDPTNPLEVKRIDGVSSIWRDFKSYGNFIYQTTDQGRDGLTIIDMTLAPDSISSFHWNPEIELGNNTTRLDRCHNLWVDEKGYAYLAGCNVSRGGILIVDIATDPYNPTYIGAVDERYAHDVIVKDTLLYASEINNGLLGIYSIADLLNPTLISLTSTSSNFTHNAWPSDDGKYIFTTDERSRAFMDVYDITDLESPKRISMYQPSPDKSVVPHNVHYLDGFLIVSWYSEGVIILDAHRPDNLVRVGQYDTHPQNDQGGDGCWGAYPFFNSGIITAGDINRGFFVLKPTYQRAAYLEGSILESGSFDPINNAMIQIQDTDNTSETSDATGTYKTGTIDTGMTTIVITHPDYITDTVLINLQSGEVNQKSFLLRKKPTFIASGLVSATSGDPIPNAQVKITVENTVFEDTTAIDGTYVIPIFEGNAEILVAAWGYKGTRRRASTEDNADNNIILEAGYEDDFFADLGWTVSGDAVRGIWERAVPLASEFEGAYSNPNTDIPDDLGDMCYVTGNQSASAPVDDVDDGTTILTSPDIDLSAYQNPVINLSTWFYNAGGAGGAINDTMEIFLISTTDTIRTNSIIYLPNNETTWNEPTEIKVRDFLNNTDLIRLQIAVGDRIAEGHLVEGGIDAFSVSESDATTSIHETQKSLSLLLAPNPVNDLITFQLEKGNYPSKIQIVGINGIVWRMSTDGNSINVSEIPAGVYQITLWTKEDRYTSRFVKI